jgi:hypothetical protein
MGMGRFVPQDRRSASSILILQRGAVIASRNGIGLHPVFRFRVVRRPIVRVVPTLARTLGLLADICTSGDGKHTCICGGICVASPIVAYV